MLGVGPDCLARIEELIHELSSEFTIVIVTPGHATGGAGVASHRIFPSGKLVEVGILPASSATRHMK